jgi:glucose-1-phosphate thymidylyltransferase
MYLGDNLLEGGLEPFVSRFHRTRADAVVAVTRVVNPTLYGVIELDGDQILSIEEKPLTPRSNLAIVGIYVFSPKIHEVIFSLKPSGRGELEITDALRVLHQSHRRVVVQPLEGWWKDTGRPADLLTANDLELGGLSAGGVSNLARVSEGATLQGRVTVGPETVIEAGAAVYGPVVLGRGVRVGKGTHIGPGTAIGDHAQLEGCTIGRSIVMEVARIVGPVKIRDSLIGRRVQILAEKPGESEMEFLLGDDSVVRIRPSDQ